MYIYTEEGPKLIDPSKYVDKPCQKCGGTIYNYVDNTCRTCASSGEKTDKYGIDNRQARKIKERIEAHQHRKDDPEREWWEI